MLECSTRIRPVLVKKKQKKKYDNFSLLCKQMDMYLRKVYILRQVTAAPTWSVRVAERLALPTLDHGFVGSNPAGGEILPEPKRRFIAQSLSCSPFHRLEMTEILLKGRKTLTHPSISADIFGLIQYLSAWRLLHATSSINRFLKRISCYQLHQFWSSCLLHVQIKDIVEML